MKTFEEKFTAWSEGKLSAGELADFERELEAHPEALAETPSDRALGDLLRTHLTPPPLKNADFFNHQLLQQIQPASPIPHSAVRAPRSFWSLPRMAFSGAFLLILSTVLYFAAVPKTNRDVVLRKQYVDNVLHAHTDDPDISVTSFHSDENNVNVVWLDGLTYMPENHKLK